MILVLTMIRTGSILRTAGQPRTVIQPKVTVTKPSRTSVVKRPDGSVRVTKRGGGNVRVTKRPGGTVRVEAGGRRPPGITIPNPRRPNPNFTYPGHSHQPNLTHPNEL